MAGIAGLNRTGAKDIVSGMLDKISHRGKDQRIIFETDHLTLGMVWSNHEEYLAQATLAGKSVADGPGFGHQVKAGETEGGMQLMRDALGVAPLYYTEEYGLPVAFASEVKALLKISSDVNELAPGSMIQGNKVKQYFSLVRKEPVYRDAHAIAKDLRVLLERAVLRRIRTPEFGSWLSGGIDSSTFAALARPYVRRLYTFTAGVKGAPDFEYAREVARHIDSEHHEVVIGKEDMIQALPDVIRHLESFDALLVRSSVTNFLVARAASGYCPEVFSGEGGDEFFAGYHYLKDLPVDAIPEELVDIASRLHNTALQRVDRSSSAHGTTAHVIFADPEIFEFAMRIPLSMKIRDGMEKWILRKAVKGLLPDNVVSRPKVKFWEGAGVTDHLQDYAAEMVTDDDFRRERRLPCGWMLNSKEELFYYRIFREFFGDLQNLGWMGRTKGSPVE